MKLRISKRRQQKVTSTSMSGSAIVGRSCSLIPQTIHRCAPLNSATRQNSSRSFRSAASRRSPSALIHLRITTDGSKISTRTQNTTVNFPIIADSNRAVATAYDMIHPNAAEKFTVRSVFVIDPNKKIRLTVTYPPATGRNFDEILRVVDALQLTDSHSVATPVNWKHGEDCIVVPTLSDEEATAKFPKGFNHHQAVPAHHTAAEQVVYFSIRGVVRWQLVFFCFQNPPQIAPNRHTGYRRGAGHQVGR